jgi:hypothetical protein
MVMPYGRKATQAEAGRGPGEIDFNALWDRAYVPVIKRLGYDPVRADQDVGALIITQMLERLYFSDLVLADMTIANGNVYYEVGIRHAAQKLGCVLLAADWSKPLFDIAQMRTVRYPLPEGNIEPATAEAIQNAIAGPIARLVSGSSPIFDAIAGYPGEVDPAKALTMQAYMRDLADLQGSIRAIRALPPPQRIVQVKLLVDKHAQPPITTPVAIALVRALRESAVNPEDWNVVLEFIDSLPQALATEAEFREQRAFALSNAGDYLAAIAELEALIERFGPSPERLGLLGGRYKRLAEKATDKSERERLRGFAIAAYERGMYLNLNEYYCSSNLPRLYRARNGEKDDKRAQSVLSQVMMACEQALARGVSDEWLRPTLLTAAFDAGDPDKAEEIAKELDLANSTPYRAQRFIDDLAMSAGLIVDQKRKRKKARLDALVEKLRATLGTIDMQ